MASEWKYRGRIFNLADIESIRQLIAANPEASRWALSRKLCEAWNWKQANGALRDMVCRGLLLTLERAGEIELPPVRRHPPGKPARPEPVIPDDRPVCGRLSELGPLTIEQVRRTRQEALFNGLVEQYHYLGYEQPVHRLGNGSPAAQYSSAGLQYSISDSALGDGSASGLAHSGPHGEASSERLAAALCASRVFAGDLRRSGTVPRDLLSGGQLGRAGAHHRARQE